MTDKLKNKETDVIISITKTGDRLEAILEGTGKNILLSILATMITESTWEKIIKNAARHIDGYKAFKAAMTSSPENISGSADLDSDQQRLNRAFNNFIDALKNSTDAKGLCPEALKYSDEFAKIIKRMGNSGNSGL